MTAEQALQALRDGNQRYIDNTPEHPRSDLSTRRRTTLEGQNPYACMVTCSDSRVPLEMVFDAGIGDLFVIRVAGNVCGVLETASVEFAVAELAVPVILVLAHTHCGAVTAAVKRTPATGALKHLLTLVEPSALEATRQLPEGDERHRVALATQLNLLHSMEDLLLSSQAIRTAVRESKVAVVGATYDIESGTVSDFIHHPREQEWVDLP